MKCVVRTLVCAPDELSRAGLLRLLAESRYKATAAKSNAKSLLDETDGRIALIIMVLGDGARMPPTELQALSQYFKIVLIADHYDVQVCHDSLRHGVAACLPRKISRQALLEVLDLVLEDKVVLPSTLVSEVLGAPREQAPDPPPLPCRPAPADRVATLSLREIEIIQRLVHGDSNKCIGRDLNIADTTVKVYVKAILRKIGASNRTQAAIWGMSNLPALPQPTIDAPLAPTLPARLLNAALPAQSRIGGNGRQPTNRAASLEMIAASMRQARMGR